EAAHEAVLQAEEDVDRSGGHEEDLARLQHAREVEHAVLQQYGFETYLDVILSGPRPEEDAQAELLDALRARRVAEDTLASLRAAAQPPAIATTRRARRRRSSRDAARALGGRAGRAARRAARPRGGGGHAGLPAARRRAAGHRHDAAGPPRPHLPRGGRAAGLRPRQQRRRAALRAPGRAAQPHPRPRRGPGG